MCGRYVQFTLFPLLKQEFNLEGPEVTLYPSWNIAPTQEVPVIVNDDGNRLMLCRWGLIPTWAKDLSIGSRMINARAETLAEKPSFKGPFRNQRCLIPADGFYEWRKGEKGKTPVYITMKDGRPFGFAGLYSNWTSPEGEGVRTCTIVTTGANELLAPIHNRMPVIVRHGHRGAWLDPHRQDPEALIPLLSPYPAEEMTAWEVSRKVNTPSNNSSENIKKIAPDT
jgi:putative SOS response-associated peptidase YedK